MREIESRAGGWGVGLGLGGRRAHLRAEHVVLLLHRLALHLLELPLVLVGQLDVETLLDRALHLLLLLL